MDCAKQLMLKSIPSSYFRILRIFLNSAYRRICSAPHIRRFRRTTPIWNDCARLVVNAIVYYNTLLLSKVYVQKLAAGDMDAVEALHGISPIAWRHVNLVGRFDFTSDAMDIDIDALVAPFSDP